MSYATSADLRQRMAPFFTSLYEAVAEKEGVDVETLITADLEGATAEIDAALAFRYRTPVTAPAAGGILKGWCLTLAEELAWGHSNKDKYPEALKPRVEVVRKWLSDIAEGKKTLPGAEELTSGQSGSFVGGSAQPYFTDEQMGKF